VERYLSRAVDIVRREEHKRALREEGDESLKGTRWFWLRKLATLQTALDEEACVPSPHAPGVQSGGASVAAKGALRQALPATNPSHGEQILERWCPFGPAQPTGTHGRGGQVLPAPPRRHPGLLRSPHHHGAMRRLQRVIETIKKNARGFPPLRPLPGPRILFRLGKLDLRTPAPFALHP